ncbi:MAG TPA: ATP-binding protein [Acidobacteriaceae bacterium]|nr:ATP-binding protein [Acidobacteriaceae bacterium]
MNDRSIPRVLLLLRSELSHHTLPVAARRAGLAVKFDRARNRREFLESLSGGIIDAVIAGPEGLPDIELEEIFDRARSAQPPVPVLVAGDRIDDSNAAGHLRAGAAEVLPFRQLDQFPAALERALKVGQSSRMEAQAQQELDRAAVMLRENQKLITIGRLAASISHEINNPLESITNLLFLLGEQADLSAGSRSYLGLAQRELERAAQICRQTLNFSRETTGPVRVHIDSLLEEVLSLYGRRIMEKNLRVERQYDCPDEAIVYPGEMRQVLSNLVTNAIEASAPSGRLRLRVRCTRAWSDPGVRGVRISVGDNGSGIPPEVQRRLGEPFFTTKGQSGTGLGLWVTRSIIQRCGGEIQLRSSVDARRHGTVFSIFLPTNLRPQVVDRPQSGFAPNSSSSRSAPLVRSRSGLAGGRLSADEPRRRANGH